ncbi:MAG: lactate/malate dehydrogenase family protein [Planctomycetota bacterium]
MKITIVGMGRVGTAIAYALTINPIGNELCLVNRSREKAEGEAMDLRHALALQNSNMDIYAGDIDGSSGSDVIVFTASVPFDLKGRSRLDMAEANLPMLKEWIGPLAQASPDAILIMVTNPVDALTFASISLSGFPASRVIGTGTLVDSVRYRSLLSAELQIHSEDIRAYILGEHGDTQFAAHSVAMTGGERFYPTDTARRLFDETVQLGYEVYKRKGHTCYGIALATTLILDSIAYDLRHTMPVSVAIDGFLGINDVCLSLPAVIGAARVTRVLHPELSADEQDAFRHSAETVKKTIAKMN